jgi:alanine racemase
VDVPTENLRCWAEIDLAALRHNADVARRLAGPGAGVMAIVKANAYGHGLSGVVRALRDRVAMYGVANVHEAQAVREALGSDAGGPGIFILGPALPGERPEIVAGGFVPAISTLHEAAAY